VERETCLGKQAGCCETSPIATLMLNALNAADVGADIADVAVELRAHIHYGWLDWVLDGSLPRPLRVEERECVQVGEFLAWQILVAHAGFWVDGADRNHVAMPGFDIEAGHLV